ncbi:hypothetical protein VTN02DRAFT_1347 [Thermoascus thermophilus]
MDNGTMGITSPNGKSPLYLLVLVLFRELGSREPCNYVCIQSWSNGLYVLPEQLAFICYGNFLPSTCSFIVQLTSPRQESPPSSPTTSSSSPSHPPSRNHTSNPVANFILRYSTTATNMRCRNMLVMVPNTDDLPDPGGHDQDTHNGESDERLIAVLPLECHIETGG